MKLLSFLAAQTQTQLKQLLALAAKGRRLDKNFGILKFFENPKISLQSLYKASSKKIINYQKN